jgi:hypothetical protein
MGFRFRKQIKLAPGVKLNLNKDSASVSVGTKGLSQTYSTTGKKTTTVGIPGSGISYSSVEKIVKDTPSEQKAEPAHVPDLEHLVENGELPVGWLYANRSLIEPMKFTHTYLMEKYAEERNKGVLVRFASFRSYVSYLEDLKKSCEDKGECFAKWFDDLVCNPTMMEKYKTDLKTMEDDIEDLLKKEKVIKQLKIDLLEIIKTEPGVVQSELYKRFDEELKADISNELYWFSRNGVIEREKSGRSYKLYIK